MEPHNNLLCLLQHFSKALCQPGGLRRERTLRVPHIADLKKRLASVDGQRFDVILLIGAVHKIQAQTANIRMEQEIDDLVVAVAVYHVLHNALVNDPHAHRFKMMFHRKEIPYSTHEFQIWKI